MFDGALIGELRWLKIIVERRIADYHRKREREIDTVALVAEKPRRRRLGAPAATEDATAAVDVQFIVDGCIAVASEPHAAVIEMCVFDGWGAPMRWPTRYELGASATSSRR